MYSVCNACWRRFIGLKGSIQNQCFTNQLEFYYICQYIGKSWTFVQWFHISRSPQTFVQAWPRRVPVAFVWIPDDFDEIDCRLQKNKNLLQGLWQSLYLFASLLNIFPCVLNIFKALAHCWGGNLLPNRKFKNTFSPNILQKSKESGPHGLNSKNSTFRRAYNFLARKITMLSC